MGYVLAMYDVRGIQSYIFRTSKLRDAIGASAQVENIITDTLKKAAYEVSTEREKEGRSSLKTALEWENPDGPGPLPYKENEGQENDIQVLYVGGGNGFVVFSDRKLAVAVSRKMARDVIVKTYSLQLATAIVDKTGNYKVDYANLQREMTRVKDTMIVSKPVGAPSVVQREVKTGYPLAVRIADRQREQSYSTETRLKIYEGNEVRSQVQEAERKLENYVTEKGVDSTIAVVHIDGNNMGMRIRHLIEDITDYEEAVNKMRGISYSINHSYKDVFDDMARHFNNTSDKKIKKGNHYFVMKVLTAGDDITYVCNAQIALSTVEYFCSHITKYTMGNEKDWAEYGFSVCGGVAFIGSHFPFSIGYDVAEACCDSAKKRAKKACNKDGDRIGNWVDFQICKNVQTRDLDQTREREYISPSGENLLRRPYFIPTNPDIEESSVFQALAEGFYSFRNFKKGAEYFKNEKNMPRSFSKRLRNTYPLGKAAADQLKSFLASRFWQLPDDFDGKRELYWDGKRETTEILPTARWYDVLELLDYFTDMNVEEEESHD